MWDTRKRGGGRNLTNNPLVSRSPAAVITPMPWTYTFLRERQEKDQEGNLLKKRGTGINGAYGSG